MSRNGKLLAMLLIGLFFGTGLGYLLAAPAPPAHDHASHDHAVTHDRLTEAGDPVPALGLDLQPEPDGGLTLHMEVSNFRFAPENANGAHVPGEGHAHVYIDGDKIARAYGPWLHIAALPEHAGTLSVTLNANDHSAMAANGAPIIATADLEALR